MRATRQRARARRGAAGAHPAEDGDRSTDKQVYLRGDGAVQYQDLMEVIDRLKDAGVQKVGIVGQGAGRAI